MAGRLAAKGFSLFNDAMEQPRTDYLMVAKKTRFAPSPTGLIHLGNARTALFSALLGQQFLLRIEDTDQERSRTEFVASLIDDLHWMGIEWQEGPKKPTANQDWFQSERSAIYAEYYDRLIESAQAYPCYCTPTELEVSRKVQLASGKPPRYSGKCRNLSADDQARLVAEGRQPTLRFRVPTGAFISFDDGVRGPQKFLSDEIGDFIIRRADGSSAFFFCNAIDDSLMGVTHVVRGEDHLTNTPRQIMILEALALSVPAYAHTALILGDDGAPLSKRNGSRSIQQLREEGYFPLALANMMARLGHHYDTDEFLGFEALKQGFSLTRVGRSPARFDLTHLNHWQSLAVRSATPDVIRDWITPRCTAWVPEQVLPEFLELVRANCLFPREAEQWAECLFSDTAFPVEADCVAAADAAGPDFFRAAMDFAADPHSDFQGFLGNLKTRTDAKGKALFMPLRAAFTGRHDGPELALVYRLITPQRRVARLAEFIQD